MEGTGVRVLVADDNSKNVYMLEVLLKGAGYEVVTAKDGIEALEKLRAGRFDGIVSDILMPRMDGFRLIRECKNDPALRQIPFIFYTATYTEKKDEEFGLSLGAIRYLIKPAEPEELLRQIRETFLHDAAAPGDIAETPVLDEVTFSREYTDRVGAKLEKKAQLLAESEEKYRLLYDNSMDAILLSSPDGSIQAANPAACSMFQRTEEEIIRDGRAGIIDPADPHLPAALEERTRTGRFVGELTLIRKDGTRFPGEISSSLFTDRHGHTRSGMIIRDISERRKAEKLLLESKVQLAYAMELAKLVNWEYDVASDKFTFNDSFYTLYGTTAEREGGYVISSKTHTSKFVYPEDIPRVLASISDALATKDPHYSGLLEHRIIRGDGEIRYILARFTVILDEAGKVVQTHGANQDITERRMQEQVLLIANQKLNLMNMVAWHDIYNKVTGLRGYVELSREHITDPKAKEFLKREEEILKVIHQQILCTKEYQEIGMHPPRWNRMGNLMENIRMTVMVGSIRVMNYAEDLELYADPVIERVFWHLVDNSVKHGERVTEIRITARESSSGYTIIYEDNGVGIPETKREDLFTRSFGKSTGFDLFFVHDILEINGMNIEETGETGKGARFEISIPKGTYRCTGKK